MLHPDIKRFTYDAIKFNVDKMTKADINHLTSLSKTDKTMLSHLADEILQKKWPTTTKTENCKEIFSFIFECSHFLRVFFFLENNIVEKSQNFKEKQAIIISLIESSLKSLAEGDIQISLLKLFCGNVETFTELLYQFSDLLSYKIWKETNQDNIHSKIKKILEYRTEEINNFSNLYKLVETFYNQFLTGDLINNKSLKKSLEVYFDIDELILSDLCHCLDLKEIETVQLKGIGSTLNHRIIPFKEINLDYFEFLKKILLLATKQNIILSSFLTRNLRKYHVNVEVNCYIKNVLLKSYEEYINLGQRLSNGSLLFREFDLLSRTKADNTTTTLINPNWGEYFEILMKESKMSFSLIAERLEQIQVYQQLDKIENISTILLEIKEIYKSVGDFKFIKDINNSLRSNDYSNKQMNEIDNKIIEIYKCLEDLSDSNLAKCLKNYITNFEFIEWLKKTAPNLNALKLLCEFASESENEGALEVVRVQSLSMVGTAYSPLIYDLKPNFTYEILIEQVKLVQRNLSKNPNLSDKIEAISKEKSWLEEIKDSKGNTEANSLKQAARINETGIFDFSLEVELKSDQLSLNDLIRLRVPRRDKEPEKAYSYLQLRDLNDKLTLVVGKQQKQQKVINEFEGIFEGLINMGQIYLNLIKTGNVLFNNWNATIYCSPDELSTMKVNFGLSNQNQNIFANRDLESTTMNSINKTIKFLQDSYNEWLGHVSLKREKYPNLNYYRIDQIVMLRAEIAKSIGHNLTNYKNLFDLLHNINSSLTKELINEANQAVFNADTPEPIKQEPNEQEIPFDRMDELLEFGFDKNLIREALKQSQSKEFDDLLAYCIEHQTDELNLAPKKAQSPKNNNLLSFSKIKSKILFEQHDAYEEIEDGLDVQYARIWKRYSNYLDCNFEDFVSLNHLGQVLDYLKSKSKTKIQRLKPPYLEKGVPNLIICPQDEIINRVLSIYMISASEQMPTNDEVLYCNQRTTFEELELFWKRVLLNNEDKIYCLLNVQDLVYDQAVKAQLSFEKLQTQMNSINKEFTLCIFCSSEKEDKSVFATSFNRYKKNVPIEKNIESKLNSYLSQHFKIKQSAGVVTLQELDKDNLSVRVLTSDRSGVGKSLHIKRTYERAIYELSPNIKSLCISVKKKTLPYESIFRMLKDFESKSIADLPRIIHIDIAYEVWYEVDFFLFNLLCLGVLQNSSGDIFRRSFNDLYLIEIMTPKFKIKNDDELTKPLHNVLTILPYLKCLTPVETLSYIKDAKQLPDNVCPLLFDNEILRSDSIQRPCQYLQILNLGRDFENFEYKKNGAKLNVTICLELLLKHLEHNNPSWSEIIHFSSFLNNQLIDCEHSNFCNVALIGDLLPGFKTFVIKFMIQMSHDFALPSLIISDRSALQMKSSNEVAFEIDQLKMRRKWENDPHPYLFFNPDGQTFTFFGFFVNKTSGILVDPNTNNRLFDHLVLSRNLIQGIDLQDPNLLKENIGTMTKQQKIYKILRVMGVEWVLNNINLVKDPDPSYELTMDNLLKMLAIYMRLKANIPVIIMGETGCGKTRLCKYLCELQISPDEKEKINNMHLVKVHGGTTTEDIIEHVKKAQELAKYNSLRSPGMFTILFFDEANSTEAIGTIKEIMCDARINGIDLEKDTGLKIIAACNPYKKHSEDIIKNFEKSGLGFYVDINETQEKLGDLPMRHLVYRVQPLPASMLPIIWDFGQLNDEIERLYITQIVNQKFQANNFNLVLNQDHIDLIVNLLSSSQMFMRNQKNECSFVSLRDVQRVLTIIQWFLDNGQIIFNEMQKKKTKNEQKKELKPALSQNSIEEFKDADEFHDYNEELTEEEEEYIEPIYETNDEKINVIKSIILALNTSYHVGLKNEKTRKEYRKCISRSFNNRNIDENYISEVINECYEIFLDEICLPPAIARNQALKENVFMMLICTELKIPLFIIGKPGSSKSLAKTLIAQKMQGTDRSNSPILSTFKEAHLITFQCSPLSTAEMILKTFRYCAKYQLERKNDLDRYASVVVLDEIGLAEASPSMPLKTLHPLLEDGVYFEEEDEKAFEKNLKQNKTIKIQQIKQDWHKVGFIGISNWILDPAKMNRGIVVNRSSPTADELKDTVIGICKNDQKVYKFLENKKLINSLSTAYLKLCESAKVTREFFGLRDFYCLIKMIYWHIKEDDSCLDQPFLERAIRRNFGGLADIDPVELFFDQFSQDEIYLENYMNKYAKCNVIDLIKEALMKKTTEDENRYLLLLSQNENALDLINNYILKEFDNDESNKIKIIFGSSFPNDQKYSQICRKIHQIKLSMELGKTVILLNLENLYESLYDALNQFYYKFGDNEKFVDLGLGTQRVKCLVHNDFRLIVVADKASVYNPKKYPIPLVNRLEKHLLSIESILDDNTKSIVDQLKEWCLSITSISAKYSGNSINKKSSLKPSDIFIGFTEDSIPTLVFKLFQETKDNQLCIDKTKEYLIQCGTSDGIIRLLRANLANQNESNDLNNVVELYFKHQNHDNFNQFFDHLNSSNQLDNFVQITTHSKLLSFNDLKHLSIKNPNVKIWSESLLAFDTQQQFIQVLKDFFNYKSTESTSNVLIIQCDCGHFYPDLINCARYTINDEYSKYLIETTEPIEEVDSYDDSTQVVKELTKPINTNFKVILIIQIPKISGGCISGFQTTKWLCYHIDDLQDNLSVGNLLNYKDKSLSDLFTQGVQHENTEHNALMCLLKSVIYIACSKINDYSFSKNNSRSIRRIEILLQLLNDDQNDFCKILLKYISKLQTKRESLISTAELSKSWLFNEAAKLCNVIKYGTLKNSCVNYIENRLSHLLSGIIALLDTNNNLDLLIDCKQDWLASFWTQMFNNEQIINLTYEKYYLQSNSKEKTEFVCLNKHLNNLKLKLPFSWLIKQYLDDLTQLKIKELENETTSSTKYKINQLNNAFKESFLYKLLIKIISANQTEFIQLYLNDFLILAFKDSFQSVEHFRLVKKRITDYCLNEFDSNNKDLTILISFHLSFENLKQELYLFSKFIQINPKIVVLLDKSENDNVNLCFLATRIVCNDLATASSSVKRDDWDLWFKRANKSSILIETFMNSSQLNENNEFKDEFETFRSIWEKCVIIKVFIENVCHLNDIMYVRCILFWKFLDVPVNGKKIVNLKKFVSFERLLKFLELINKQFKRNCKGCNKTDFFTFYSIGCGNNSPECLICENCKEDLKVKKVKKCPVCSNDKLTIEIQEASSNFRKLKESLNCFFMEIVTNLCFDESNILPEPKVIDSIIDTLLPKPNTEDVKVLDFTLSPSIKSTLFQILLNYNKQDVEQHLNDIFSKSANYLKANYNTDDLIDLKLMYINSIEDNFYSKQTLNKTYDNLSLDIKLAADFLTDLHEIDSIEPSNEIDQFKKIAQIKFIIITFAKIMSQFNEEDRNQVKFIKLTKKLIHNQRTSLWPRFFLIKHIFRRYGKNLLSKTKDNDLFNWIQPEETNEELVDSFVICGQNYLAIRNTLRDSFFTGCFKSLEEQLNKNENASEMFYSMAIFKEITLCQNEIENYQEKCQNLLKALEAKFGDQSKQNFENLIEKKNISHHFTQNQENHNIALLLMHLNCVLSSSKLKILRPFQQILNNPLDFKDSFLPSLPHDDDFEILQNFKQVNKEPLKFFECKNGHLYSIGDCTKPATTSTCPTCKDTIGGAGYVLSPGNKEATELIEKIQTGYCLPDAIQRSDHPESIRNMGVLNTAILRLILDSTLYLSTIKSDDAKALLSNKNQNVKDFFADQIIKDINILSKCLQHSPDESLLIIHFLLSQLQLFKSNSKPDSALKTKENRNKFEQMICDELFLKLIGADHDKIIKQMTQVLSDDVENSGTDQLFRIAHDLIAPESDDESSFLNDKKYWSFRKHINVESMINSFNSSNDKQLKVLNEFIVNINELEALKYLPQISKMMNLLFVTFNRQVDRLYAYSIKVGEFINQKSGFLDHSSKETIKIGCESLLKAWKTLKMTINSKFNSNKTVKLDLNNPTMNLDDYEQIPLSYLLPSTIKDGRYIYYIIFYLINLQNEFIQFYSKQNQIDLNSSDKIEIEALNSTNSIGFTINKDILQIVFMHSNYSLGIEQEIDIEYNFAKIQFTISKRFLEDKMLIETNVPLIEYSDDINDMSRFESLNRQVPQNELTYLMKEKITSFYKQPNELNDIIRKLHIVIDFVISGGCATDTKIMDYAIYTLKMSNIEESNVNKQISELEVTYLKSLWNLLTFRRVVLLTHHGQDAFDQLSDSFKQITAFDEDDNKLKEYILRGKRCADTKNLLHILNIIYKLIVYKLIPSSTTITDENELSDEIEIGDLILELVEQTNDSELEKKFDISEFNLSGFKVKNAYHIWKLFVKIYFDNLKI